MNSTKTYEDECRTKRWLESQDHHHSHIVLEYICKPEQMSCGRSSSSRSPRCLPLRLCRPSSLALAPPGKAPFTRSSPRSSAAPAQTALQIPTTALSASSSAPSRSLPIRSLPEDVFSFAHGIGLSGREPSPVTVGARLSCISSFFKFLIRLDLLKANPCDPVERPKPRPGAPSGLSASQDAAAPPGHPRYRQGQT